MRTKQLTIKLLCRMLPAIMLCGPVNEIRSQTGAVNDGVDTIGLSAPNNYIYLGRYNHATEATNGQTGVVVTKYEFDARNDSTPILWRVMGMENGDGAITLLSEYVLDTCTFGVQSTGGTMLTNVWANSIVAKRLGTLINCFTGTERSLIVEQNTVVSRVYNTPTVSGTLSIDNAATESSPKNQFYLPWGTPSFKTTSPITGSGTVFWNLGNNDGTITVPSPKDSTIDHSEFKAAAGLKSGGGFDLSDENIHYWLRNRVSDGDFPLYVQTVGTVNYDGIGMAKGIRPMFRLGVDKILFAYEILDAGEIERTDQMQSVKTYDGNPMEVYLGDDVLLNGRSGAGKAYKLTVLNSAIAPVVLQSPTFDPDETIADVNTVVRIKPGDTLRLGFQPRGNDTIVAYKLVKDAPAEVDRALARYGDTAATASAINLVARNLYLEKDRQGNSITAAGTLSGDYIAYLWAQKNHITRSHEGSAPIYFKLKTQDDDAPPTLTADVYRSYTQNDDVNAGDTAIVTVTIGENHGGKYYYMVDPTSPPSDSADLIEQTYREDPVPPPASGTSPINASLPITSGKITFPAAPSGTVTITFPLHFGIKGDNEEHTLYIVAKDSVRNTSELLAVSIPPYVPNKQPTPKPLSIRLGLGGTKTVAVADIATDEDVNKEVKPDVLKITNIDHVDEGGTTPIAIPDPVATTSLSADGTTFTITASDDHPGPTWVQVTVNDQSQVPPTPGTCDVLIPIAVVYPTPAAEIDYIKETLINLLPNEHYLIDGDTVQTLPAADTVTIRPEWFGKTAAIQHIHPDESSIGSDPQNRPIPARRPAPNLTAVNETFAGYKDGYIYGFRNGMEYRLEDDTLWTRADGLGTLEDLAPGKVYARYYAIPKSVTDSGAFAGEIATVTVGRGFTPVYINRGIVLPSLPGVTSDPPAGIHYIPSTTNFPFSLKVNSALPPNVRIRRGSDGEMEDLPGVPNPSGGYDYVIYRVQSTVSVYIDGVSGNQPVAARSRIWSSDGQLYIRTNDDDTVTIYDLTGQHVKQQALSPAGTTSIPLKSGIYIVTLSRSGERRKVVVK